MRSLEKNRSRRYETAAGLAADARRHLAGEPIEARPPSTTYRLRKLLARHRAALAATLLVAVTLIAATVTSVWFAVYALEQKEIADGQRLIAQDKTRDAKANLQEAATALFERAVRDVLMNNQVAAAEALNAADTAGASQDQIAVLHGFMALHRGNYDEAVRLGEKASKLDPQSVAARSLKTVAYVWSGRDDLGELELHELRPLKPQTDTERLLKAYAFLSHDKDESKRLMEGSPAQRSPVGLVIRGFLNLFDGWEGDRDAAEKAIQDFGYVRFFFNENPASVHFQLTALELGIRLAKADGRNQDVDRYQKLGRELAERLAKVDGYPAGDWSRQMFYLAIGEEEQAWQAIRRVGQHPGTYSWFLAMHCLERFGVDAMEEFDKTIAHKHRESKYVQLARALLLAHADESTREALFQEVLAPVRAMVNDPSPFLRRHALLALCPFCSPDQIQKMAADAPAITVSGLWDDVACLQFLAKEMPEQELLSSDRTQRGSGVDAHFTVAMMYLSAGNETTARRHLRECVESGAVGYFDQNWARAILSQLDADDQ